MLKEILNILRTENTPLSLDGLSQRLDVDKQALKGMLETLMYKGLIKKDKFYEKDQIFSLGGLNLMPVPHRHTVLLQARNL